MGNDKHEDDKLSGTEDRQTMDEAGTTARFGKRFCNGGKDAGQLRQTQKMVLPAAQQGYPDNKRPRLNRGHQEAQKGLQPISSNNNGVTQRCVEITHDPPHVFLFFSFLFSFCLFGDVSFSEYFLYHCRFLFEWRVRRTLFISE